MTMNSFPLVIMFNILILIESGCTLVKSSTKIEIELSKEILVNCEKYENFNSTDNYYQPLGKEYVYFFNTLNSIHSDLYVLKLDSFSLHKVASFDLKNIESFSINDSLKRIVFTKEDSFYVYDFQNKLMYSNSIFLQDTACLYAMHFVNTPLLTNDNKLYISYFKNYDESYKDSLFFNNSIECEIDLQTKSFRELPIYYPEDYKKNSYGFNFLVNRLQLENNKFAYFFSYSDSVFILDTKTQKVEKYYMGTKHKRQNVKIPFYQIKSYNDEIFDKMFQKNTNYLMNYILSNQSLIVRQYCPNDNEKGMCDHWSYIFYDTKFNHIGKTEFSTKSFQFFDTHKYIYSLILKDKNIVCRQYILD